MRQVKENPLPMSDDIILSVFDLRSIPPGCPYCFRPQGFKDDEGPLNPDEPRYEIVVRQMIDTKVTSTCHECGKASRVVAGDGSWRYQMERVTEAKEAGVLRVSDLLRLVRYDDGSWALKRHASTRWEVPMNYEEVKNLALELPRIIDHLENGPNDTGK